MKVLTILGTRPEIIRLCRIIEKLDNFCEQIIVHTGQNYDTNLNDIFFEQLGVRAPDYHLGARGSFGEQLGAITTGVEKVMNKEKPDKFLVLGDTNSSLAAIIVKRLGVPVYHMEAGNRCHDDRVPEEVNRRIIDHSSDVLLPYTERSRSNLLHEGIPSERIYVTGNPIYEVIKHYEPEIAKSSIHKQLGLEKKKYFLATTHRQENVDVEPRLRSLVSAFEILHQEYGLPIIVSTHPRTRNRMEQLGLTASVPGIKFLEPFGFMDFVTLERDAFCLLSDSGTVQEEGAIFGVPNVTLRDTTERPETIECGSNILSGVEVESIVRCVKVAIANHGQWKAPPEYLVDNVSDTVCRILLGYRHSKT